MKRREFIAALGGTLAWPASALAQSSANSPVIGILSHNPHPKVEQILEGLRPLGWVEGQNLIVERAYANRRIDRLPALAEALVRKRVDVIWAGAPNAAVAAARATKTIPIVFSSVSFPEELGLVESLARPGGNATGVTYLAGGIAQAAKPLEFLREIAPQALRLAHIWTPTAMEKVSGEELRFHIAPFEAAVRALGYELQLYEIARVEQYEPAFRAALDARAQALLALTTPLNWVERKRIIAFASQSRLPGAFDARQYAEIGGLLAYGPDVFEITRQSARHIDRIFRGAKPADLPVEIPEKQNLAVNLKTARALGLDVPRSILLRADKVIE